MFGKSYPNFWYNECTSLYSIITITSVILSFTTFLLHKFQVAMLPNLVCTKMNEIPFSWIGLLCSASSTCFTLADLESEHLLATIWYRQMDPGNPCTYMTLDEGPKDKRLLFHMI